MTLVTTSRKPVPELRSLAKDLAFAIGTPYFVRGKTPWDDLRLKDPLILLFSQAGKKRFAVHVFLEGKEVLQLAIPGWKVDLRPDARMAGVLVADQSVYEALEPYIPVKFEKESTCTMVFDGTRRRHYMVRLIGHGA